MAKQCENKNPLVRGGTSQGQRLCPGLQPGYVQVEEHSFADLLVFARQFAGQLKYFNADNQPNGDWAAFFSDDVSILIALFASTDLDRFEAGYETVLAQLLDATTGELNNLYAQVDGGGLLLPAVKNDLPAHLPAFKQLFDVILSLADHLDRQIEQLPAATGLREFARASIRRECQEPFRRLLGYYKVGINQGNTDYVLIDPLRRDPFPPVRDLPPAYAQDVIGRGLAPGWLPLEMDWQQYLDTEINAGDFRAAFGQNVPLPMARPEDVANYLLPVLPRIAAIFQNLLNTYGRIVAEAPRFLAETMDDWPSHEPYIGLYLAFLKLLKIAYQYLNGLKERHLDYYYQEVLHLRRKAATPDQVHLVAELARHVEDFLLQGDTGFQAGKDGQKKEVTYVAPGETALNKSAVQLLRSLYHTPVDGKTYVAPVANSEDGQGEALTAADGSWPAFGPVMRYLPVEEGDTTGKPQAPPPEKDPEGLFSIVSQTAPVGFAVASPNLFIKEGDRIVKIRLRVSRKDDSIRWPDSASWTLDQWWVRLTGKKGWIETQAALFGLFHADTDDAINSLTFAGLEADLLVQCHLTPDDPPVLPYDPVIHQAGYTHRLPMVQVLLREINGDTPYKDLRNFQLKQVRTQVVVTGVRDLLLQNDHSRLDPTKKFHPFGPLPKTGNTLTIGSREVFQKKFTATDTFSFVFEWEELEVVSKKFVLPAEVHVNLTSFTEAISIDKILFTKAVDSQSLTDISALGFGKTSFQDFDFSENRPPSPTDRYGFMKLELKQSFGHDIYQAMYPLALVQLTKDNKDNHVLETLLKYGFAEYILTILAGATVATLASAEVEGIAVNSTNVRVVIPDPPYTPVANALSINYSATSTFSLAGQAGEPFDQREEYFFHLFSLGYREVHAALEPDGALPDLFPPFPFRGEVYIGLKDARPRQQVSVLFQVAEGSANPLKAKQEVVWSYLDNNRWTDFAAKDIVDTTNDLLQSGIARFQLPKKIGDDNTWLDGGYRWLRAAVISDADAVCRLIAVRAQAFLVTFADNDNAADFLATPLAAGAISKMRVPSASVKKIEQPYTSFGGRVAETPDQFYRRVSERLRHKNRAVAIWDYESLVLEAFPDIYKVKCLNHTSLKPDLPDNPQQFRYNEVSPGHVLVVTIPDLKNRNAVDPLRPYTNLATLEAIREYLQKRTSLQVDLDVKNPLYEQIRLNFDVRFRKDKDPTIYKKVLNEDIIAFLSPWATGAQADPAIEFGGRIHKSVLLDFIEERDYVDVVLNFRLDQLTGPDFPDRIDVEEAVAGTGRSVLVSHPEHTIREKTDDC